MPQASCSAWTASLAACAAWEQITSKGEVQPALLLCWCLRGALPPLPLAAPGATWLLVLPVLNLTALLLTLCREGGQRLLSTQGEHLAIEASASPPPRLPSASEHRPLMKGQASSSSTQPQSSPPMPQPFFPPPPRPKHRRDGSGGDGSSPEGGSPKAMAMAAGGNQRKGSRLNMGEEDEDICPTCLDPYTGACWGPAAGAAAPTGTAMQAGAGPEPSGAWQLARLARASAGTQTRRPLRRCSMSAQRVIARRGQLKVPAPSRRSIPS